jgi:hypothetical protein
MRGHLGDEQLMDLAEGGGEQAAREHALACGTCGSRVDEARAALALALRADTPEPSPLYWEAMRRGVGRRIEEATGRSPRWLWLAPLAAAAVAVFALSTGRPPEPGAEPSRLPAWSALPDPDEDPSLAVLEAIGEVYGVTLDDTAGVGALLAGLSDEESRALADSLRRGGLGGAS